MRDVLAQAVPCVTVTRSPYRALASRPVARAVSEKPVLNTTRTRVSRAAGLINRLSVGLDDVLRDL